MPNKKITDFISEIPVIGSISGTELILMVQDGEAVACESGTLGSPSPGGGIESIVAGANVMVDNTDPKNPVVSSLPGRDIISFFFAAGSLTLDAHTEYFNIQLGGDITDFLFVNLPGASRATTLLIKFVQDSTPRTVTWPASFKWAGGTAGAVSTAAGAVDILALTTFDNGTTWQASLANGFA